MINRPFCSSYTVASLTLELRRPDNKVGVRSLQNVGIEMSNKYGGRFVYRERTRADTLLSFGLDKES